MRALHKRVSAACEAAGLKVPSRASLYNSFAMLDAHTYATASLPPDVASTLYNLDGVEAVPGHQLENPVVTCSGLPVR